MSYNEDALREKRAKSLKNNPKAVEKLTVKLTRGNESTELSDDVLDEDYLNIYMFVENAMAGYRKYRSVPHMAPRFDGSNSSPVRTAFKRLDDVGNDKVSLEVYECECGFHIGLDASYLEQVAGIDINCPSCSRYISASGEEDDQT